jgi:hypothetical protein
MIETIDDTFNALKRLHNYEMMELVEEIRDRYVDIVCTEEALTPMFIELDELFNESGWTAEKLWDSFSESQREDWWPPYSIYFG